MELYIIICISFAIMFHLSYTSDIIYIVKKVVEIHEAEGNWNPIFHSVVNFILSTLLMPAYLLIMLVYTKKKILYESASTILLKYYELELKER